MQVLKILCVSACDVNMFCSREVTLNFIEDYRNLDVLWNSNKQEYFKRIHRRKALEDLGSKYGIDVLTVKKKIKNIRSYFWKEHERILKGGSEETSGWFAYSYLLFLKDINGPCDGRGSVEKDRTSKLKLLEVSTIHIDIQTFQYK